MRRSIFCFFLLIVSTFPCLSQSTKQIIVKQTNPTSYLFHFGIDSVRQVIVRSLDRYNFQSTLGKENYNPVKGEIVHYECLHLETFHNDGKSMWSDAKKVLSITGNQRDIYLYTFGYAPSQVYFASNCTTPLIFAADYHLHLDKVDSVTTRVIVNTIDHRVVTGRELIPTPQMCGIGRSVIIKTVPLTTVEQYEILLRIGKTIGENEMPALVVPAKVCLTRKGKLKR